MGADAKQREAICRTGKSLFDRGLAFGGTGSLSVRLDDGGWLITPGETALGDLDPGRLCRLDERGRPIDGDAPTEDVDLHLTMYRERRDAGAVVHLHAIHTVALSCLGGFDPRDVLPPITGSALRRIGRLPLVPFYPPGDRSLAEAIGQLAGRHHALLLANHGSLVAGKDLDAAVFGAEEVEHTARLVLMLRDAPVRLLTPEQVDNLRQRFGE